MHNMARKTSKAQKTNAMRELDAAGIAYEFQSYEVEEDVPSGELGTHIAEMLGEDPDAAFKTLVCVSSSGEHVVSLILRRQQSHPVKRTFPCCLLKSLRA